MGKLAQKRSAKRSRDAVKRLLANAFRARFPHDTVDVSDGYRDNIHVLVVSREFDKLSEAEKQDLLWNIIDETPLRASEKSLISLVLPVSPAEIK